MSKPPYPRYVLIGGFPVEVTPDPEAEAHEKPIPIRVVDIYRFEVKSHSLSMATIPIRRPQRLCSLRVAAEDADGRIDINALDYLWITSLHHGAYASLGGLPLSAMFFAAPVEINGGPAVPGENFALEIKSIAPRDTQILIAAGVLIIT